MVGDAGPGAALFVGEGVGMEDLATGRNVQPRGFLRFTSPTVRLDDQLAGYEEVKGGSAVERVEARGESPGRNSRTSRLGR